MYFYLCKALKTKASRKSLYKYVMKKLTVLGGTRCSKNSTSVVSKISYVDFSSTDTENFNIFRCYQHTVKLG